MGITNYLVKRIQASASQYRGNCTYPFSQTLDPVASMIGKSKVTKGGICQALSEMWVVFHAHDGALWNWLCPNGQVNSSALANLAYNFTLGSSGADGKFSALTNQDQNSDLFFLQYGIRRRSNAIPQMSNVFKDGRMQKEAFSTMSLTEGSRGGGTRAGLGLALARDLTSGSMVKNMGQGDGTYRMIGIFGGSGAHCMCAFVGKDVAFFDPNFGEFHFANRDDFARWFGEYFWPKSFYDWVLSKSYTLRDYARAVGPGAKNLVGKF